MINENKAAASVAALDSGTETEKGNTPCFANGLRPKCSIGISVLQLENKAIPTLMLLGFSLKELDDLNSKGFDDFRLFAAAMTLLAFGRADEYSVRDTLVADLPLISRLGGALYA